ncbi:MAG: cation-translocating P-type ATPase [Sphingobacteriales bacterium]|nr:cation-translocating P-type ATPase [Sphingobacteriales bacterium]
MFKGLNHTEVKERLSRFGYNELPSARPKNIWRIALEVFREPMFLLLISCGLLYMILGDYQEGIIMLCTIFIIIFITFYQYRKTERALEALKKMASPRAQVIRDGAESRIPGREVVPDDILVLNEGDRIAADAVLLETLNLTVDESLLTGESVAVSKVPGNGSAGDNNRVFSGTLVVQGSGIAKVTATGPATQFGRIGISISRIREEETKLQQEMKALIRRLFIAGVFISLAVVVLFYITRGNFIQSLLNGLSSAMAILPEEFPVVLTVFLALGAWRLSRRNVLTRKSSAIETLGSATVLCADKTGTLTQNKMEVSVLYDGHNMYYADSFRSEDGFDPLLIRMANQASRPNSIDPMEMAIRELHDRFYEPGTDELTFIREYPLSREMMAMSRVLQDPVTEENGFSIFAKGAPESIFILCRLSDSEKENHLRALKAMADEGYRVIGVAMAEYRKPELPEEQTDFEFRFRGLVGLADPIRPEVKEAVNDCRTAGIKVIMITGDYAATAASIARQIGLPEGECITGPELNRMSEEELRERIPRVNIFARVVPEQKLRIVLALKANREIVAMTGDGVNDAPALKAAHIGVAMGKKGTDVAREASSLVLLDDQFSSIVSAIRSGRRIFDNLQKAMSYILAIHIPVIGLTLLPAFFPSLPVLLMPLHIVFMEMIIDPVCSVAFESEQEEKGIMNRPPRDPSVAFFGVRKILNSFLSGILLLAMVAGVYFLSLQEGHTEGEVRAIAFSALITGNIFLILTQLSKTRNVSAVLAEKNYILIFILLSAFIMLLLTLFVPALRQVFSFAFPGTRHFIPSLAGSLLVLTLLETIKISRSKKRAATG